MTEIKNIPGLLISELIIIFIAFFILKKEIHKNNFKKRTNMENRLFILDNIEMVGLLFFGILLILLIFI